MLYRVVIKRRKETFFRYFFFFFALGLMNLNIVFFNPKALQTRAISLSSGGRREKEAWSSQGSNMNAFDIETPHFFRHESFTTRKKKTHFFRSCRTSKRFFAVLIESKEILIDLFPWKWVSFRSS